jgi:hypothetical protein
MPASDTISVAHIAPGRPELILGPGHDSSTPPGATTKAGDAYHWVMLGVCLSAGCGCCAD